MMYLPLCRFFVIGDVVMSAAEDRTYRHVYVITNVMRHGGSWDYAARSIDDNSAHPIVVLFSGLELALVYRLKGKVKR